MIVSAATSKLFTPTCKYCDCIIRECCPANKPCPFYGINFCIGCFFEYEYDDIEQLTTTTNVDADKE